MKHVVALLMASLAMPFAAAQTRCECEYDDWEGDCDAEYERDGDWVVFKSDTEQCSRIDWHTGAQPRITIVKDGKETVNLASNIGDVEISIASCKVCKDRRFSHEANLPRRQDPTGSYSAGTTILLRAPLPMPVAPRDENLWPAVPPGLAMSREAFNYWSKISDCGARLPCLEKAISDFRSNAAREYDHQWASIAEQFFKNLSVANENLEVFERELKRSGSCAHAARFDCAEQAFGSAVNIYNGTIGIKTDANRKEIMENREYIISMVDMHNRLIPSEQNKWRRDGKYSFRPGDKVFRDEP